MRVLRPLFPLLMIAWSRPASAAPSEAVLECIDHSEKGQAARDRGELVLARGELARCALERCPSAIRSACSDWSSALEPRIPSLLLDVQDEAGRALGGATVQLDDQPLDAGKASTEPIAVDPGPHTFRVTVEGREPAMKTVNVREGEQRLTVTVTLPARVVAPALAPPPPMPARRSGPPLGSWILGGVGVAAIATGAAFEVSGMISRGNLDSCAPFCDQDRVDGIRRRLLVGDLAIAAGLGFLVAGAAVWIFHTPSPRPSAMGRPFVLEF